MKRRFGSDLTYSQLIVFFILLIGGTIVVIVPFLWMILTSFKTFPESVAVNPIVIFPANIQFEAYRAVMGFFNFGRLYINTISVIIIRILFSVITASMAAYALARLRFTGKTLFFTLILIQLMVPWQIFVIPQYLMVVRLRLLDTIFALAFPGLITTFGTFLLRQFFMSLPASVEESAKLDGANPLQVFARIMLPMVNSGLVAVSIFTALWAFRDLLWPIIVNTNIDKLPISAALARLQGQSITYFHETMAAATLASIPMIIIYAFFQKRFIQGMATSGLKY